MSTDQSETPPREGRFLTDSRTNAAGLKPFYSTPDGNPTVVTEADLAHTIHEAKETSYEDLVELDRYWSVFPYSYISICQSKKHGELRYFVVEPYLSDAEKKLLEYLIDKIQSKIRNYDTQILSSNDRHRRAVIREAAIELLETYNMSTGPMIRHAHADSEYVTDEFELEPNNFVESIFQRVLLGESEEFTPTKTRCAQHALSYGATASYEYLHLISDLDGHPDVRDRSVDKNESGVELPDGIDDEDAIVEAKDLDTEGSEDSEDPEISEDSESGRSIPQRLKKVVQKATSKIGGEEDAEPNGDIEPVLDEDENQQESGRSEVSEINDEDVGGESEDRGSDTDADADADVESLDSDESPTEDKSEDDVLTDGGGVEHSPQSFEDIEQDTEVEAQFESGNSQEEVEIYHDDTSDLPPSEKRFELYDAALTSSDPTDETRLTSYQIYKLLYYIERQFVGYKKIDAIKNDDKNVEDITVAGYDKPAYVYHKEYGQIRTNVNHGRDELDAFITTLAQMSGEELSRRQPETDAKLPDGSRAEMTLGYEISDTGSEFTIRQFKEIPHTPVDLINWQTYGLDQMALLWLFVENGKSIMVAGGTGAGKTTTLNALSLFIPSDNKIVSIEDTPELDLPHENWSAGKTRESSDLTDDSVEIDEFDLLKQALRKRPDRIILGEIRGEEAFELFQSVRTGHPGLTTFHATSVDDIVGRMTSEPINVPTALLTALDLVLVQGEERIGADKVRRNRTIQEIESYQQGFGSEGQLDWNEISYWNPQQDEHQLVTRKSLQLEKVEERNGWTPEERNAEIQYRRIVLSALIVNEISSYKNVSAFIQAAILDPEQVLEVIANDALDEEVGKFSDDLSNISIDTDFGEQNVDRPEPPEKVREKAESVLRKSAEKGILSQYV